jgi:hypothetical protein
LSHEEDHGRAAPVPGVIFFRLSSCCSRRSARGTVDGLYHSFIGESLKEEAVERDEGEGGGGRGDLDGWAHL